MKTKLFLIAAIIFSISVSAENSFKHEYCAKLKDGILTVTHEGTPITSDITLANGTTIKIDGTVIQKDGSTVMLKEGECINKDGKIMKEKKEKSQEKTTKEKYK
ncbi:MAG: hypothetical protein HYU69_01245 [Bacteroidetes bacterium]|nr:hypothetical protein [Bacteroidota bacterium]